MINSTKSAHTQAPQFIFDQYPWAENHKDAISCITRYMPIDAESVVRQFEERILGRIAKQHLYHS